MSPLVFIDAKNKKDVYIAVLEQNLLGYIDALMVEGLQDIIFQQDNVSPHVATITQKWLENAGRVHEFTVMEWLAILPDLNPIENLWAWFKLELHRHYPDTKYLHGSPETVKGILKERLNKVWWDFGEEVLNQLIESMPEHVQAVLEARGKYTRF